MSQTRKVYVVTGGEYSDYQIIAIFDDLALAEQFAGAYGLQNPIEEFMLNPTVPEIAANLHAYCVRMVRDGTVREVRHCEDGDMEPHAGLVIHPSRQVKTTITIWARDDQHAIKITDDMRAQAIAEGIWQE